MFVRSGGVEAAISPLDALLNPSTSTCVDIVLDTNVVLGWLLFHDPRCDAVIASIETGRARWLASAILLDELRHVLGRGIAGWTVDSEAILAECERRVCHVEQMPETPTAAGLRCTDVDDQKFIDFALASNASALLTHDRAVLRLARRAAKLGLWIGPPERWRSPPVPARRAD